LTQGLPEPACAPTGQRGVALILVLWVLALVSALILAFLGGADTSLRVAHNDAAAAQAQALAESGVTLAILGLSDPNAATRWRADGTARQLSFGGGTIDIKVEDENGKVDLNVAPPELFIGLFRTLGADDASATAIAAAIINWRSGTAPAAAGDSTAAAARQFYDVGELSQIPGVTRDLFRAAAPFLTVYSFSPYINPMTAPAEVLRSLPGVTEAAVDAFLASRADSSGDPTAASGMPAAADIAVAPVTIVTITARARTPTGARFAREAVVALGGTPGTPFTILAWGQPRYLAPAAVNP